MGAYAYKYVRDQIPPYITDEFEDYEGNADYDGDQWLAASNYISALEYELAKQYAITKKMYDEKLLEWLKTRPESPYCSGAPILENDNE